MKHIGGNMNKLITLIIMISTTALFAAEVTSPSQVTESARTNQVKPVSPEKIRFEAILNSFKQSTYKWSNIYKSNSRGRSLRQDYALAASYERTVLNQWGYVTRMVFTQFYENFQSLRVEVGATYGLTKNLHTFMGINLNEYTKAVSWLEEAPVGLGFQAGVNYNLSDRFGVSLSYVLVENKTKDGITDLSYGHSGLEVGLSTYF
jgi:hypothetical protein